MLKLNIQSTVVMTEEDQKPPMDKVMAALRAAATRNHASRRFGRGKKAGKRHQQA